MSQLSFADPEFTSKRRKTVKVLLLGRMNELISYFRHLLEKHKLGRKLLKEVHKWLSDSDIYFKDGKIVDATIIEPVSSTKNNSHARDPEIGSRNSLV